MILTPETEIRKRLDILKKSLEEKGFGAALIYQNVDIFYYTGTMQRGALYVPIKGYPLFMVIKNFERANTESSIKKIVRLSNPVRVGEVLKENGYRLPDKIGVEMDVIPAKLYKKLASSLSSEIGDISLQIRLQRAVKSEFEIKMMKKAASILKTTYAEIPNMIEEGITETELSARIEYCLRSNGHQGIMRFRADGMELYAAHLSFGKSAATPVHFDGPVGVNSLYPAAPQIGGNRKLKPGVPIIADIVAGVGGYLVDSTRTFALKEISDKFLKQYRDVIKLNSEIKKRLVPDAVPSAIYDDILIQAKDMGYEKSFMSSGDNQVKFIAHGIGLEVDEIPVIAKNFNMPLALGNTLAVEPKIISSGIGGVGIENTYLITKISPKNLTGFNMELQIV